MADKAWKANERAIARILNGRRVPITGRARDSAPDVAHPWLSIECKHRRSLPGWIREALAQAQASARDDQLAVAVLHQSRARHADDLVVIKLSDFCAWFGRLDQPR